MMKAATNVRHRDILSTATTYLAEFGDEPMTEEWAREAYEIDSANLAEPDGAFDDYLVQLKRAVSAARRT